MKFDLHLQSIHNQQQIGNQSMGKFLFIMIKAISFVERMSKKHGSCPLSIVSAGLPASVATKKHNHVYSHNREGKIDEH